MKQVISLLACAAMTFAPLLTLTATADTGAKASSTASHSASPLFRQFTRACSQKDEARALALIKAGLGANEADEDGNTVLGWAARGGLPKAVEELIKGGADVQAITNYHYSVIRLAIGGRSLEAISYLLSNGVDVNLPCDGIDYMPLMEGARFGYSDIVQLLLARGAKVNAHGRNGVTALEEAAEANHADVIAVLADHGAEVDRVGSNSMTPLMWAALSGNLDAVKALVALGAKPNLKSHDYEETALVLACRPDPEKGHDHLGVVKFLLASGANPSLRDKNDQTALFVATVAGCTEIMTALVAGGAKANSEGEGLAAFRWCLQEHRISTLQTLLDLGANPNWKVADSYPALIYAIEISCDATLAGTLIKAKVDVNVTRRAEIIFDGPNVGAPLRNYYEYSALIAAVKSGSVPIVRALLQSGADASYQDSDGKTALDVARATGNAQIVALLSQR